STCWPGGVGEFSDFCLEQLGPPQRWVLQCDGFPVLFQPDVDGEDPLAVANTQMDIVRCLRQYPFLYNEKLGWYYRLLSPDAEEEWLVSTGYFKDQKSARLDYDCLLELLSYRPNYRARDKVAAKIYQLEIVETLLDGKISYPDDATRYIPSSQSEGEEAPLPPVVCPAEYNDGSTYPIVVDGEVAVTFPVEQLCSENSEQEQLCPRAWEEGLSNFLVYAINRDRFYAFQDVSANCHYSFRVVQDGYRVARNPKESHTPQEREFLISWLYQYSNFWLDKPTDDLLPYQRSTNEVAGGYQWALYQGDVVWQSPLGFGEENDALDSVDTKRMVELIGYAQEPDFYQVQLATAVDGGSPEYRILLMDESGVSVLESSETFVAEVLNEEVAERIRIARKFPIYCYNGNFGFQCFSEVEVPDFASSLDNACLALARLNNAGSAPVKFTPTTSSSCKTGNTLPVLEVHPAGEVIWESIEEYDSYAAAANAFRCFQNILQDRENYQRRHLADCNLFGLELTRPDYVLAEHPRRYLGLQSLEMAIQETMACISNEGFHLVEHLLLRPRSTEDATIPNICPLPAAPIPAAALPCKARAKWDQDCKAVPIGDEDASIVARDHLVLPPEEVQMEKAIAEYVAGADPYSFWATVVLPYWPNRFQNSNFRTFFEDTLRREAPAHVALRICWLSPKDLKEFERKYRRWLETLGMEDNCARGEAQAELIEHLFAVSSVYPPARLDQGGCDPSTTQAGTVLLDFTQLS
ncbi:MAG: hypothetical protein AAFQ37_06325, partial [Bacteroidota bacterium]